VADNRQTNMASSDTDDDITSTLSELTDTMTRKQTTDQSQIGDRARNCRRTEMVSI